MYSHVRHLEFKSDFALLVLNHDNKFYLTSQSILIACLLDTKGKVST